MKGFIKLVGVYDDDDSSPSYINIAHIAMFYTGDLVNGHLQNVVVEMFGEPIAAPAQRFKGTVADVVRQIKAAQR